MMWVLIGLSVGCAVYGFSMFNEYRMYVENIMPQIEDLEMKGEKFEQDTEVEVQRRKEVAERVEAAQQLIKDQQHEIRLVEEKIKKAQQAQEQIERDMYKKEFKRTKSA